MTRIASLLAVVVPALAVAMGCQTPDAAASADSNVKAGADNAQAGAFAPIKATAPQGIDDSMLGAPVDVHFHRLDGHDGASLFDPSTTKKLPQTVVEHGVQTVSDSLTLQANLSAWVVNAKGSYESTNRYDTFHASQVVSISEVDEAAEPTGAAPPGAVFYVSKIFWGHSYEAVFEGSSRSFGAGLGAALTTLKGDVEAVASTKNLKLHFVGSGLTPKKKDGLFVQTPEELLNAYEISADPVPIFVEYKLLPRVASPANESFHYDVPKHVTVKFKTLHVENDGAWFSTQWRVSASCSVGSAPPVTAVILDGATVDASKPDTTLNATLALDGFDGEAISCTATGTSKNFSGESPIAPARSDDVTIGGGTALKISGSATDTSYSITADLETEAASQ
jgi:hypothetical protein